MTSDELRQAQADAQAAEKRLQEAIIASLERGEKAPTPIRFQQFFTSFGFGFIGVGSLFLALMTYGSVGMMPGLGHDPFLVFMTIIEAALGLACVVVQFWFIPRRRTWVRFFKWERTSGFLFGVVAGAFFVLTQLNRGF